MFFQCSGWRSGKGHHTGMSYGLKVPIAERNRHFKKEWESVILEVPKNGRFTEIIINTDKPSFWNASCRELISTAIRQWLWDSGHAPWPRGQPPKFMIEVVSERHFRVVDAIS